jgi:hypothetical protein
VLLPVGECTSGELGTSSPAGAAAFTRTQQSALRSMTVASCGASRMPRLLEAWVEEPEQARGRFDGDRCFARRSDAVAQQPGRAVTLPARVDC